MRLPKFRWVLLVGAIVGGLIPLLYFTVPAFQHFVAVGDGIYLWPSGLCLLATDGREHELIAYKIIGLSILANMLLYAFMFSILWCGGWVLRAWRGSVRDDTTI